MSICIMVKVGEGLVLASDSASTISGAPIFNQGQTGPQGIVKIFYNSTKIFQIAKLPIGVFNWGAASFSSRTVASLVEEFENKDEIQKLDKNKVNVKKIAKDLQDFMLKKSDELFENIPKEGRPKTGFLVCGYSKGEFFSDEYTFSIPDSTALNKIRPDIDGKPNFGANWYGMADAIIRFHHGRDDKILKIVKDLDLADDKKALFDKKLKELPFPILFPSMPLGDAIDFAKFLVDLTIARFRFVIGAELCGGPVDVATITRKNGFGWIYNKNVLHKK